MNKILLIVAALSVVCSVNQVFGSDIDAAWEEFQVNFIMTIESDKNKLQDNTATALHAAISITINSLIRDVLRVN